MIGHGELLTECVFLRSPNKGFWACLGDLPPDMPRRPVTSVLLCNLMLKLRGISHSSAILGSDSPQSNNRKGKVLHSSPVRDLMSNTLLPVILATTGYTSAWTDASAALAPLLSGGTRVRHWQSARRLWPDTRRLQLPLDDCCGLVLPYIVPYSIQQTEQIPNNTPLMEVKNTTTSNHRITRI